MDVDTSFGRWLRHRRRALDQTQDDLARRVGCAIVTIQKLESDERRPSRLLAERLADSLMVAAEERAAFIALARAEPYLDPAPVQAAERSLHAPEQPPSKLPTPLTHLIGRKQEIAAVRNALLRGETRLLTLLGPPGIGKTSLSIAVARELQAAFADGASFVALAPISEPALVLATIAQILRIKESGGQPLLDQLKAALQMKRRLLVLDNFEHVLAAAPLIVDLLEACPGLKALITSRAALHVRGERLYALPPLLLPDLTRLPATSALARTPAVALFVERAQAVLPRFKLTAQNAADVAAICVRLDGLPLAIELAAARMKLLPAQAVLERLEQRLVLLTDGARDLPPRQRTLRAAIGWSYELLDAGEQTLFARLGVFVSGCTIKAATAVCNETNDLPMDVTDGIASLLDKSLLQLEEAADGESRFLMLETLREYALERLAQRGEAEALRERHLAYYLALAETAAAQFHGADQLTWLDRLEAEHDNFRAALAWGQAAADSRSVGSAEAAELGLRLAGALAWFRFVRGYWSEGRTWLTGLLACGDAAAPLVRATALNWLGDLESQASDNASARTHYQASLAIGRAVQDKPTIAIALRGLGLCALMQSMHDFGSIEPLLEESLALFQELGDTWNFGMGLHALGQLASRQRAYDRANVLLEESLALFRRLHDSQHITLVLVQLGMNARLQGEYTRAESHLEECLTLAAQLRDRPIRAEALNILGNLARNQGDYARAAACYDESLALCRDLGNLFQIVSVLQDQGYLAQQQGDQTRAAVLLRESLARCREIDYQWVSVWCLAGLGRVAVAQGQAKHATRLLGATAVLFEIFDPAMDPIDRADYEHSISAARADLDAATFAAAWAQGRAMTLEQAIVYALNATSPAPPPIIPPPPPIIPPPPSHSTPVA